MISSDEGWDPINRFNTATPPPPPPPVSNPSHEQDLDFFWLLSYILCTEALGLTYNCSNYCGS